MAANFTNDEPVSVSLNDDNSRQNSQLYTHRNLRSKNFNNKNEFNVNENRLTQHVEDDDIIFLDDTKENRPTVKVRDQFMRSILIDEDDDKDEENDSEKNKDLKNDEMLARQLQEEFDKELAISLEHDFIRDDNAQQNDSNRANDQPKGEDFFYNLRRLRGPRRETAELRTAAATGPSASDQQTRPDFFLRQPNRATSSSDEGTTNNQTDSARSAASLLPPSFETDILYSLARNSARNNQHNNNVNNNHRHGMPPFGLPRNHNNNNNNNQRNTHQTNNRNQRTANADLFSFTNGNNDSVRNLEQAFSILAQPERASQNAREDRPPNSNNNNRNHFTRNGNMRSGQLIIGQNRDHNQQSANFINNHTVNSQFRAPQQRTRIRNNNPFFNFQLLGNSDFSSNDYENLLRLDEINGVKRSLNKNEIDSLAMFEYKANGDKSNDSITETCSICYDEFAPKDLLVALSCMHKFHKKCIVQWLQESRSCPLCKKDAVTGE